MDNAANLRLAMRGELAEGQERGGLQPSLFRLYQTVMNRRQVVKCLLILKAHSLRLHSQVV
jgi:hypothetical protein